MKKHVGWWLILVISLVTVALYFFSKGGIIPNLSWRSLSQVLALLGTVWLCVSYVLSTRMAWVNNVFGGMDKMYRAHHIIGGLAFAMVLHHPIFLAIEALPNAIVARNYLFFSRSLPFNLGVMSIYLFLLLLILTLLVKLPYSMWKTTHNFMGIPLLFAGAHILTITSDVSNSIVLRFWIVFWLLVGITSAIYKRFFYEKWGPRFEYKIAKIERVANVYVLSLEEISSKMEYQPGQFVFLKIDRLGGEYHPYSIVSYNKDRYLKLAIKILGDYTVGMERVTEGDFCTIQGPYGDFFRPMKSDSNIVMVAGGIGITPFIGMIKNDLQKDSERKIELFYTVRSKEDALFLEDLRSLREENGRFNWKLIVSGGGQRLDCNLIRESVGSFANKKFLLCGPQSMMICLAEDLKKYGVKNQDIIYEDFSFK